MAVRNDFAAGEVLAAADLNDTFASKADYPSGGSNGDLLTKSGTTTAWAAPSVAGLTLITAESFSAVSSVSVNGCFSAGGADATTNYVGLNTFSTNTAGPVRSYGTGQSSFNLGAIEAPGSTKTTVCNPFASAATNTLSLGYGGTSTAAESGFYGGHHTPATSYSGFTIFPSSSTITGTVRVYGYKD
jgi:hypothetical protein